ncbi:MAG: hypothetical protein ACHQ50_15065 [Fimbriimonadales bacterium]
MKSALQTLAEEYIWLWDTRHGASLARIAKRDGVSIQQIQAGIARALLSEDPESDDARKYRIELPPRLIPLFPIGSYTPASACPHRGPIAHGSHLCCMVCHRSGIDGQFGLQLEPQTDPEREPKRSRPPLQSKLERRRQRLARL